MGTFFKNIGLTDIPALFTELGTQLTLAGWSVYNTGTSTSAPASDHDLTRELVAVAPGLAAGSGDPAHHVLGFTWVDPFAAADHIACWGAQGIQGPVAIDQVTYLGATATVQTVSPHPFRTGDLVFFAGVSPDTFNIVSQDADAPAKITLIGSPGSSVAWTQTMNKSGPGGTGSGGFAYALYNFCGYRAGDQILNSRLYLSNGPLDVYGYVDEFRLGFVVVQAGGYWVYWGGRAGREHIQSEGAGAAKITNGPIVSDGIATSVIDLDRSINGTLYVGCSVQAFNPNDATPESVGVDRTTVPSFTVDAINSNTQIECILPAGTWQNGAIIGLDASHCIVGCATSANLALGGCIFYASTDLFGSGSDSDSEVYDPRISAYSSEEADVDPDAQGIYHGLPIVLQQAGNSRKYMPPFIGVGRNIQNDADIMVGGDPANSPLKDYVVFPSVDIDGFILGIGPGAN